MNAYQLQNWFESHKAWLESEAQKEFDRLAGEEIEIPKLVANDPDWAYENERDNNL